MGALESLHAAQACTSGMSTEGKMHVMQTLIIIIYEHSLGSLHMTQACISDMSILCSLHVASACRSGLTMSTPDNLFVSLA